jgi:hypothetical protein
MWLKQKLSNGISMGRPISFIQTSVLTNLDEVERPRRSQTHRHPSASNNNPYQAQRPHNLAVQRTPLPMSRVDGPSNGSGVGRRDGLAGNPGRGYVAARSDLRSGGIGDPLGCGRCCVCGRTDAEDRIEWNRMGVCQPPSVGL